MYILKFDLVNAPEIMEHYGHKKPFVLITDLKGNLEEETSTDMTLLEGSTLIWLCKKSNNSIVKERVVKLSELKALLS
jgi:hypothetical protein